MTQEEKELLLVDLCARLLYAPKGVYSLRCDSMHSITFYHLTTSIIDRFTTEQPSYFDEIVDIKLYLRPMSDMTEEEKKIMRSYGFELILYDTGHTGFANIENYIDEVSFRFMEEFLNAHHFDYRGLIPKGLALKAPEDMYKI